MKCNNCNYEGRGRRGIYRDSIKGEHWKCPKCRELTKITRKTTINKELEKAQQKYQDYLRNYLYYKDLYDDYYNGTNENNSTKNSIYTIEIKMNHCFDMLETLTYIFGVKVR